MATGAQGNALLSVDVDTHGASDLLAQLALLLGRSAEEVIVMRAPMLGRYLAAYTQPVADKDTGGAIDLKSANFDGTSKKARQLGQAAVQRDLLKVYKPLVSIFEAVLKKKGPGVAAVVWSFIKKNKTRELQELLQKIGFSDVMVSFDGGALHRARKRRGRVPGKPNPMYVGDVKALEKYVKLEKGQVGFAKSGWVKAGDAVPGGQGAGKAPAWMRQNAPGLARVGKDADGPYVTLVNAVSYVSEIMSNRTYLLGLNQFVKSLEKEVASVFAYVIAKEKGVKRG